MSSLSLDLAPLSVSSRDLIQYISHHPELVESIEDYLFGRHMQGVDTTEVITSADFLEKYANTHH